MCVVWPRRCRIGSICFLAGRCKRRPGPGFSLVRFSFAYVCLDFLGCNLSVVSTIRLARKIVCELTCSASCGTLNSPIPIAMCMVYFSKWTGARSCRVYVSCVTLQFSVTWMLVCLCVVSMPRGGMAVVLANRPSATSVISSSRPPRWMFAQSTAEQNWLTPWGLSPLVSLGNVSLWVDGGVTGSRLRWSTLTWGPIFEKS